MMAISKRSMVLSVLFGLSALPAICIRRAAPDYAWLAYVFIPLTTALLVIVAATAPQSRLPRLKWGITLGLVFSLAGDVLLMLPGDLFIPGLLSFLCTHVCYLAAFTSDCDVAPRRTPAAVLSIVGVTMLFSLWPKLDLSMFLAVSLYTVFILAMAAQATGRSLALRTPDAITAGVGAAVFVLSDSLLAIGRFHGGLPWPEVLVLVPYFTGQWLIAVSVSFCLPSPARSADDASAL